MKRILQLALRLYPSPWRTRYGAEFQALLEDVEPSWRAVFDALLGAACMQAKHISAAKITIAFALAGLLLAVPVAFSIKDTYSSTSLIRVSGAPLPHLTSTLEPLVYRTLPTIS